MVPLEGGRALGLSPPPSPDSPEMRWNTLLQQLTDIFRVGPSHNDHHPAIRCAIGVGVPLLVLLAIGRTDLSLFAALGAFTGVYGRGEPHRQRLAQQAPAAVLLLIAIFAAALTSHAAPGPEAIVEATALVAGAGYIATSLLRLQPAGSLFFVFAYSAVSFMSHPAPIGQVMLTAGLTALFSIVVGVAGRLLPSHRTPWTLQPKAPVSAEESREIFTEAWMHVVSVIVAGFIALAVGFGHGYWAMIASTAPLVGATAAHRVARGLHRILGTCGGLVITGFLLSFPMLAWQRVTVVIVLQFFVELFIVRNYSLAHLFITPLALIMTEVVRPTSPWLLIRDRGIETLIGAAIGMLLVVAVYQIGRRTDAVTP